MKVIEDDDDGPLVDHSVDIRHIVKRIGIIKRVDIAVHVVLRYFGSSIVLMVAEDVFSSDFMR